MGNAAQTSETDILISKNYELVSAYNSFAYGSSRLLKDKKYGTLVILKEKLL
jgi:hypothetical protein